MSLEGNTQPTTPQEPANQTQEPAQPQSEGAPAPTEDQTLLEFLQNNLPEGATEPQELAPEGEPQHQEPQEPQDQQDQQGQQGQQGQQEPILGKFNSYEDLEKAYQEAERAMHLTNQEKAQLQQHLLQMQMIQQQILTQTPQQPQQPQQPEQPQLTPEQKKEQAEEWLNRFYDDPMGALEEVVQGRVQQVIEPISQEINFNKEMKKWEQQLQDASMRYQDFNDVIPEMQQVISEQGHALKDLPNAVDAIYGIAKSRKMFGGSQPAQPWQQPQYGQPATPQPIQPQYGQPPVAQPLGQPPQQQQQQQQQQQPTDINSLLNDPEVKNQILQNPDLRNEIVRSYVDQVKKGQPPVVMGGGPQSGGPPATPPEPITSVKDAGSRFHNYLRTKLGRQ